MYQIAERLRGTHIPVSLTSSIPIIVGFAANCFLDKGQ
jgi:hypothetical protein